MSKPSTKDAPSYCAQGAGLGVTLHTSGGREASNLAGSMLTLVNHKKDGIGKLKQREKYPALGFYLLFGPIR